MGGTLTAGFDFDEPQKLPPEQMYRFIRRLQ